MQGIAQFKKHKVLGGDELSWFETTDADYEEKKRIMQVTHS